MSEYNPFPNPHTRLLMGDIFSGIGGWKLAAGPDWNCVFSAENDPRARQVWEANNGRPPDCDDILLVEASVAKFAHVYTVSFPCQSSSQAGKRFGRADPRGGQVLDKALEMLKHARPIIVILENVKGFLSVDDGQYFNWLVARLKAIGYSRLRMDILSTHDFGIPQQRKRLYMVAFRDDFGASESFCLPKGDASHTPSASKFLKRRLAKRYVNTIRCGGRGSKDRHAWDMIPRSGGGWYQLTVEDCKRLMGFPVDFKMPVPLTQQFRLLGNAVPTQPSNILLRECKRVIHEAYAQLTLKRQKL